MDSQDALKIFELENNIVPLSSADEKVYCFDSEQQKSQTEERPWRNDIYYYEKVEISSIALVKMVMHARSGGDIEVMGIMLGKVVGKTMIVLDAFGLPVESTETRVNAQAEGNEYMVEYIENGRLAGRNEPVIGWYHSHPGYGCWLSGIDVATQKLNQQFTEPFLAVVVDPKRTMSAGKVDLGAFRTFPDNHQAAGTTGAGGNQGNVPLSKIEDFGVHSDKYYSLEVSYFKSSMDQQLMERLWRKHWINTLSQSPLITNNDYTSQKVKDLAEKISLFSKETHKDASYAGILREGDAIAEELAQGHESNKLKMKLFGAIEE